MINFTTVLDDENQVIKLTIPMADYAHLFRMWQVGIAHRANESKEDISQITDMKILRELYDEAKRDYERAGKTENITLWNESQSRGLKICNQMDLLIKTQALKYQAKEWNKP
jgi:hypothetical protein